MGIISVEKADRLYWLGRYTERVFTTIRFFFDTYDTMIDTDDYAYINYCDRLNIPDVYGDKMVFSVNYLFDENDPNSVYSNLLRAYDNAIMVRDELSTTTLSYLEMSINQMRNLASSGRPVFNFQSITDYLYAFWGALDDCVEDEECRNIIKVGRYQERLDLDMRFNYPVSTIHRDFARLVNRLQHVRMHYDEEKLTEFASYIEKGDIWRENFNEAMDCLCNIIL